MPNLVESNKNDANDVLFDEVNLENINMLEETNTPAIGIGCGYSCWGLLCGGLC